MHVRRGVAVVGTLGVGDEGGEEFGVASLGQIDGFAAQGMGFVGFNAVMDERVGG